MPFYLRFRDYFSTFISVNQRFKYDRTATYNRLKKEVLSRETYSRNPINYSEGMADDQKDRFIQYLAEQHQEDELTIKVMKLVLEDFMNNQKSLDEQMAPFQSKLQMMENKHKELQHELSEEREKT